MGLSDKEIRKLIKKDPEMAASYIRELQDRVFLNSSNSSLAPSLDLFEKRLAEKRKQKETAKQTKSLREKSDKKVGGQPGHKGVTLEISSVDSTEDVRASRCSTCGFSLEGEPVSQEIRRVVRDLDGNWKEHHREYVFAKVVCPQCGKESAPPLKEDVKAPFQYGPRISSLVTYMNSYHIIPIDRVREFLADVFNFKISSGTIVSLIGRVSERLESCLEQIRQKLVDSEVIHVDETGMHCSEKRSWLHVASTDELTHISHSTNRGTLGMNEGGVLPHFQGTAVHDGWKAYFDTQYDYSHALCNAHHLRELTFIHEEKKQRWAKLMKDLLLEIKAAVDNAKQEGKSELSTYFRLKYQKRYQELLEMGLRHPDNKKILKTFKRGRPKQSKAKNLLDRLENVDAVLAFMYDFKIPFDNNQAERDIRMVKVKQKVSGCFRSEKGLSHFCNVKSYISTLKKNSLGVFQGLIDAASGAPVLVC